MADKPLKTVTVDGLSIETTDQGAQVIEKLQKQLADTTNASAAAVTAHNAAIAAKDKELGTKDAEIEKLKQNQIDGAKLDKLVADRAVLLGRVAKVADGIETAGKSFSDIRRAAVAKKLGDDKVKDKSDDYVEALFDALAEGSTTNVRGDPVREVIANGGTRTADAATAHASMVDRMTNAWKGETAKGVN